MKIYLNTEKKMELKLFNNKIKRDGRGFFINVGDYIDELIRTQHFDAMRNVETKLYEEIEVYKDAIDYNVIALENLYVPVDRMENWNFDRIYLNKLVRLKVNNRRRNADYKKVYVSGYYGASKNDFYEIQMPTRCGEVLKYLQRANIKDRDKVKWVKNPMKEVFEKTVEINDTFMPSSNEKLTVDKYRPARVLELPIRKPIFIEGKAKKLKTKFSHTEIISLDEYNKKYRKD